ncbi:flagellar motor protein MotB, partial [Aequorivita sp. KMM 9714]|nr:flagellar motor protein MotB [Aequorivita sp. KMM 9714]NGX85440.1 flagellar motor protein MotB [Aequorivita sp. KMM 9714]
KYYYRAAQSLKSLGKHDKSRELLETYTAKGGTGFVIKTYDEDIDYLKSTVFKSRQFVIEMSPISSGTSDFGPAFYMKDKLVYASAANATGLNVDQWTQEPYLDLFIANRDEEGLLSNPKPLGGDVNTQYHE